MAQWQNIFKDKNEWNEKTIIGGASFGLMVLYAIAIILGSVIGYKIQFVPEIFNSLVTITLGSFGIAEVSKTAERWQKGRTYQPPIEREHDVNDNPEEVDDYLDTE